jgi:hypothetical protein
MRRMEGLGAKASGEKGAIIAITDLGSADVETNDTMSCPTAMKYSP